MGWLQGYSPSEAMMGPQEIPNCLAARMKGMERLLPFLFQTVKLITFTICAERGREGPNPPHSLNEDSISSPTYAAGFFQPSPFAVPQSDYRTAFFKTS